MGVGLLLLLIKIVVIKKSWKESILIYNCHSKKYLEIMKESLKKSRFFKENI
jgi:hypothetical protein